MGAPHSPSMEARGGPNAYRLGPMRYGLFLAILANDRTKTDDSSQPSKVAMFSHQSITLPVGDPFGDHVVRCPIDTNGTTVSTAKATALKHTTVPPSQLSMSAFGLEPWTEVEMRPDVE